jgi:hypothetical protein
MQAPRHRTLVLLLMPVQARMREPAAMLVLKFSLGNQIVLYWIARATSTQVHAIPLYDERGDVLGRIADNVGSTPLAVQMRSGGQSNETVPFASRDSLSCAKSR